jgi:PAS domain-containing protein
VPKVILDHDYVVTAANPAYVAATGHAETDMVGVELFQVFPDNPDDPESHNVASLQAAFDEVLRKRHRKNMVLLRYDIPESHGSSTFVRKHWAPVVSPLVDDDRVVGIVHQVTDVTLLREDVLRAMEHYRELVLAAPPACDGDDRHRQMVDAFTAGLTHYNELADEVVQLRQALTSRAVIEQAKGVLMSRRRCSADRAFELLRKMSNDSNVRLADVAAALVYQVVGSARTTV